MKDQVVKRMLSEHEAEDYLGLSRSKLREFAEENNCVIHIGRRILYDKTIIDKAIDNLREK